MLTMTKVMDYDQAESFYNWLESFPSDEQHDVEQAVHAALREDRSKVAAREALKTLDWWEILALSLHVTRVNRDGSREMIR